MLFSHADDGGVLRGVIRVCALCLATGLLRGPILAQDFSFIATDTTVTYLVATGEADFTVALQIAENGASSNTQGFQMAFGYDSSLIALTDVVPVEAAIGSCDGGPPEFFLWSEGLDGVTIGAIYELGPGCFRNFDTAPTVVELSFATVPAMLIGNDLGVTTELTWMSIATPLPVDNVVDVDGNSVFPTLVAGTITLQTEPQVIRGDVNNNGNVNLTDAIALLNGLFLGGPLLACDTVNNINATGNVGLPDVLYLLNFLFSGGPILPAPFPSCGAAGIVGCDSYLGCP